jgi:hypothetical protein
VDPIIIAPGFNGPRLSGNGGYVGGVLAERYTHEFGGDGTVEITLRAPVPIARELTVERAGEALMLRDGDTLVCEARAGSVAHLQPPPAPADWNEVMRRGEVGGSPADTDFHWCIVCGRGRGVGDGLRVLGTAGRSPAIRCHATCRMPITPMPRAASGRSSCGGRSTAPAPSPRRIPTTCAWR